MVDLSGRDIPRLAASLQLSEQSASLASQGPALLASQSEEMLNERARKMKETQAVTLSKLGEIIALGADKTVVAALTETVKNIDDMIKSLGTAARERLETAAQHEKLYGALRTAQTAFVEAAGPAMIGRADPDQRASSAPPIFRPGRSHQGGADRRAARQRRRQRQSDGIRHDRGAFGRQQRRARSDREGIQDRAGARQIESRSAAQQLRDQRAPDAAPKLMALGEGKTGVFKIRQKELDADDYGQTILEETRKLNVGLGISVQQLVEGVQSETDASTWQARQEISLATMVMLALARLP